MSFIANTFGLTIKFTIDFPFFRPFPFKVGRPFTIEVLVEEKETLWAVDGEHYASYAHRNPSPFAADWVQVTGVRDAALKIEKTDVYPTLAPGSDEVSSS